MTTYCTTRTVDAFWTMRHGTPAASIGLEPDVRLIATPAELQGFIAQLQAVLDAGEEFDDHDRTARFVDLAYRGSPTISTVSAVTPTC
ncbi:MAG: hypothetical protein PHQ28_06895 [Mycobacterium sp.]|nr:hypothetical protein [Mycobacterium sp.]